MLLDALAAMAAAPIGPRLLPDRQPLDLFVTVTDFRGHPERLPLNSPPEVIETEHRLVFPFTAHGEGGGALGNPPELPSDARATARSPGDFPAVPLGDLQRAIPRQLNACERPPALPP